MDRTCQFRVEPTGTAYQPRNSGRRNRDCAPLRARFGKSLVRTRPLGGADRGYFTRTLHCVETIPVPSGLAERLGHFLNSSGKLLSSCSSQAFLFSSPI